MFRLGSISLFGILLIVDYVAIAGNPPDNPNFTKALLVQTAMVRARALLGEMQAQKAVAVLEEQLPNVNGNPQYLSLLRDTYRAYIRDLHLAGQQEQAQRYLDRLCILDPSAAKDASLRPYVETPPRNFEPDPLKYSRPLFPTWKMPVLSNPFAKKDEAKAAPEPRATIRAQAGDSSAEDPFERKNQREMPIDASKIGQARGLLSRGVNAFKLARYAEARACFEQAYQTDHGSLEACREQWAYCIIKGVTEAMEQPGALPAKLPDLQKQVESAVQMAPTKMMAIGQELLQALDQRAKSSSPPQVHVTALKIKHLGSNREGWQVAQTQYFRIFHKESNECAERIGQIAETTRATMYRKWFDSDGVDWQPTCELILHPNAAGYTQMTGVPSNSPGHSRIESDPSGRVIARRLDLRHDIDGMVDAILPHETTHIVLAGMFGAAPVPRWADEGIAVLSEPKEKVDQHRRNLFKNHSEGLLFGLKELMELENYPHPRRIGAFYAQSVALVEFLTQQRGPKVLTDFIKDGLRHGYETALQRHYNMTFAQLEQIWHQQVISNSGRLAPAK
jgi:tetratricopeptide (TPR) repeat protein